MAKNITKLILKNFQQWKKGEIVFTPGLNILVGDTECGKSTLFRAISSILTGKMPEDYISKGEKEVEVKVEFSDKSIATRFRSKKDNIAQINDLKFERVGKDIPAEYFNKLGNTYISFGDKKLSLCLYSQFDAHFFITLSDYDKSKLIGSACGIDIIDKIVDSINKDIRQSNSNIKFVKEQFEQNKETAKTKELNFKIKEEILNSLQIISKSINNKFNLLETLSSLKDSKTMLDNMLYENKIKLAHNSNIIDGFNMSDKVKKLTSLLKNKDSLTNLNKDISFYSSELDKNKKIYNFAVPLSKIEPMYKLYYSQNSLLKYKLEISNNEHDLHACKLELENLENQKSNLLKDFDKCPLCGGVINE